MPDKTLIVKCPTCSTAVAWGTEQHWRPFCSERCRLIDLGAWADESHRLPGDPIETPMEFMDDSLLPPGHSTRN